MLLSSTTILSSTLFMLLTVQPTRAAGLEVFRNPRFSEPLNSPSGYSPCACAINPTDIDATAIPQDRLNSSETPLLDFTEEESDAAIQRFGCDCIACLNTIRQMRGLLPVSIQ